MLLVRLVLIASIGAVVKNLILSVLAISEREDVIPALNHEHWKVEISQLKVYVSDLTDSLLRVGVNSCRLIVELLARAALVDRHFELWILIGGVYH